MTGAHDFAYLRNPEFEVIRLGFEPDMAHVDRVVTDTQYVPTPRP
jgi:hypothetical protein